MISERVYHYTQAIDDWEHYLRVEPRGEWADDVRRRLVALREKLRQRGQKQSEHLLSPSEIANAGAADTRLSARIDERIEEYLHLIMADWLPKAFAPQRKLNPEVVDIHKALRVVSDITNQKHGDAWLTDLLAGVSSQ